MSGPTGRAKVAGVQSRSLRITDGAAAGAWIRPRPGAAFATVASAVPEGFEAYARVFHPARDAEGNDLRWRDAAKAFGTTPHREMQWHAIRGLPSADDLQISIGDEPTDPPWDGSDPEIGSMEIDDLDALCAILANHTSDREHCLFGLCTIEGWEGQFTKSELSGSPLLRLPDGRDQVVLAGPLAAVGQIARDWAQPSAGSVTFTSVEQGAGPPAEPDPAQLRVREAPNLIWPADRSWLVVSEVDWDSTLVGGSTALIESIVASPKLEAWRVEPTDSLAADADEINVAPMRRD